MNYSDKHCQIIGRLSLRFETGKAGQIRTQKLDPGFFVKD